MSLVLPNDKVLDSQFLIKEMTLQNYDCIFSFGQKPNIKNKIYIETTARNGDSHINTSLDYNNLKRALETHGISAHLSGNAGTSFCNTLYWNGLNYIYSSCPDTKMIFLHIPFYKNITAPELFFNRILAAIESICRIC